MFLNLFKWLSKTHWMLYKYKYLLSWRHTSSKSFIDDNDLYISLFTSQKSTWVLRLYVKTVFLLLCIDTTHLCVHTLYVFVINVSKSQALFIFLYLRESKLHFWNFYKVKYQTNFFHHALLNERKWRIKYLYMIHLSFKFAH